MDQPKRVTRSSSRLNLNAKLSQPPPAVTNPFSDAVAGQEVELTRFGTTSGGVEAQAAEEAAGELEPVDRGTGAMTFLAVAFILELMLWGYVGSFGTIQLYLSTHAPFDESSLGAIGAVGTVQLGLFFMLQLPLSVFARRYPHWVKPSVGISLAVNTAAMLGSSFATEVWQLILLQGVISGTAGAFLYLPALIWLQEWFIERRGTASGFIFAATGLGGAVFPYIISALLENLGFPWATRVWTLISLILLAPSCYLIRPRLPVIKPAADTPFAPVDLSFMWTSISFPMLAGVFAAGLAWYPVSVLIPTYSSRAGASTSETNLVLSLLNIAATLGGLTFGYLSDRAGWATLGLVIGTGQCLAALASWSTATHLREVIGFAILMGSLNGQTSIWASIARDIAGKSNANNATIIFSTFSVVRGVACIVGPLVAAALYQPSSTTGGAHFGHFGFGSVQLWVACTAAASAATSVVVAFIRPSSRKSQYHIGH